MRVAGYQRLMVCKSYPSNIFEQIVNVAYLKKSPRDLFCTKRCSYKFYRKTLVLESLINDVAGFRPEGLQGRYFPVQVFSTEISEIFNNSYF